MSQSISPVRSGKSHSASSMRRSARQIDVIIIGAGHAGLAMSAQLSSRQVEHVVLEAGDIGERWRRERWDSLSLLTPNWTLNLPGQAYDGAEPDGFMHKDALAGYLHGYANRVNAPVKCDSPVHRIRRTGDRYRVTATQGEWVCRSVVLATGAYSKALIPKLSRDLPERVQQMTARDYRNPDEMPEGKVLVVGGSATGLQLAEELRSAGREVMLSVGEHVRMPRQLDGRDIYWWLIKSGVFWEQPAESDDLARARRLPSPQLIGRAGADLNLNRLEEQGVEIVGRFAGVSAGNAQFSGNLPHLCKAADLKMQRLLERFNDALPGVLGPEHLDVEPSSLTRPRLGAKLGDEIDVVLWATGYKPDYPGVELDVFDAKGKLKHDRGIVCAPGVYALGLPVMRSRASTFVAGALADTAALSSHLHGYLDTSKQRAPRKAC